MKSIRAQLAPGWTPLNIGILVVLFVFIWWPLGLLMLAYILFGEKLGVNLLQPATFKEAFSRLTSKTAASSGTAKRWSGDRADAGSSVSASSSTSVTHRGSEQLRQEREQLDQERAQLNRERAEFEAERKAAAQERHEDV